MSIKSNLVTPSVVAVGIALASLPGCKKSADDMRDNAAQVAAKAQEGADKAKLEAEQAQLAAKVKGEQAVAATQNAVATARDTFKKEWDDMDSKLAVLREKTNGVKTESKAAADAAMATIDKRMASAKGAFDKLGNATDDTLSSAGAMVKEEFAALAKAIADLENILNK